MLMRRSGGLSIVNASLRDTFLFYLAYAVLAGLILAAGFLNGAAGGGFGPYIGAAVLLFHAALPAVGAWRGHDDWFEIWVLSLAASIWQVLPDWFLAAQLKVLVFPNDFLMIGPVSGYMAGMWAIAFFLLIRIGREFDARRGPLAAYLAALLVGGTLFVGSEATLWLIDAWRAVNVVTFYHVAYYVVGPELLLALSVYFADRVCAPYAWPWRLLLAPWIALSYTGALACAWMFLEGGL